MKNFLRKRLEFKTIALVLLALNSCSKNLVERDDNQCHSESRRSGYLVRNDSLNCTIVIFCDQNPVAVLSQRNTFLVDERFFRESPGLLGFRAIYHGNDGMMGWGKISVSVDHIDEDRTTSLYQKSDEIEEGEMKWHWSVELSEHAKASIANRFDSIEHFSEHDRNDVVAIGHAYAKALVEEKGTMPQVYEIEELGQVSDLRSVAKDGYETVEICPKVEVVVGPQFAILFKHPSEASRKDYWLLKAVPRKLNESDKPIFLFGESHLVMAKKGGAWGLLRGKSG